MKRIILHWTGGKYSPNAYELQLYHFLIDDKGNTIAGKHTPEDNMNCKDNVYAAHTGDGNTDAIGVALCGMWGYKNKRNIGAFPLKQIQFERAFSLCANLCKKYGIQITPDTVLTHYEFGLKHPKSSSAGKIDINFLPYLPNMEAAKVGDFIRSKIYWYSQKTY